MLFITVKLGGRFASGLLIAGIFISVFLIAAFSCAGFLGCFICLAEDFFAAVAFFATALAPALAAALAADFLVSFSLAILSLLY
jgi:hypothetical protein